MKTPVAPLRTLAAALAATFVLGAAPRFAQQKPVTLRYASGAPPKTPWVVQMERLIKYADEESKGSIKIDGFAGAQLGNEQDTIQQVARGRIDMGGFATGAVALIAQVSPAQREEWRRVMAPAWPQMVKEIGGESEGFFRQVEAARKVCETKS